MVLTEPMVLMVLVLLFWMCISGLLLPPQHSHQERLHTHGQRVNLLRQPH